MFLQILDASASKTNEVVVNHDSNKRFQLTIKRKGQYYGVVVEDDGFNFFTFTDTKEPKTTEDYSIDNYDGQLTLAVDGEVVFEKDITSNESD